MNQRDIIPMAYNDNYTPELTDEVRDLINKAATVDELDDIAARLPDTPAFQKVVEARRAELEDEESDAFLSELGL